MPSTKQACGALLGVTALGGVLLVTRRPAPAEAPAKQPPAAALHPERAALLQQIEKTPGVLWKAGASPRFAAQAPGASKRRLGLKEGWKASFQKAIDNGEIERVPAEVHATSTSDIPESFDAADQWPECRMSIVNIRDQSNCGCCWAFAAVGAASDRLCIQTGRLIPLSAEDVCFNGDISNGFADGCDGGMLETAWRYMQVPPGWNPLPHGVVSGSEVDGSGFFGKGWCSKFSLPHCHHHGPINDDPYPEEGAEGCPSQSSPSGPTACDTDANATFSDFRADKYAFKGAIVEARGEEEIQRAILAGGPMEIAFDVYEDFELYDSGIYHHVSGEQVGGHAVKVVGWGEEKVDGHAVKYWKIANSWNPYWGEEGHFRMRRGTNECGMEDLAVASSPAATWSRAGGFVGPANAAAAKAEARPEFVV